MSILRGRTPPIGVAEADGPGAKAQAAALCWRREGGAVEVLLITSRDTGRWVLPKGWPERGELASDTARREAWEEAGVRGTLADHCAGLYAYHKVMGRKSSVPCVVAVYAVEVDELADAFPEAGQRRRAWFAPREAAELVEEPELREILAAFAPA